MRDLQGERIGRIFLSDKLLEDYLKFNEYHIKHSPTHKRKKLILYVLPAITFIFLTLSERNYNPVFLMLSALFPVGWLCGAPLYWRYSMRQQIKSLLKEGDNSCTYDKQTLSIHPEGATNISETAEVKIKWKAVNKVVTPDSAVYVYVGAMKAFIVPNTAFASDSQRQEFLEMALRYREQAAGLVELL